MEVLHAFNFLLYFNKSLNIYISLSLPMEYDYMVWVFLEINFLLRHLNYIIISLKYFI